MSAWTWEVEWIITSVVLMLVVLLIRFLFKEKISAGLRYGIWFIVLVRLLIPVTFAGSSISVLNLFQAVDVTVAEVEVADGEENGNEFVYDVKDGVGLHNKVNTDTDERLNSVEENAGQDIALQGDRQNGLLQDYGQNAEKQSVEKYRFANGRKTLGVIWIVGMVVSAGVLLVSNIGFGRRLRRNRKTLTVEGTVLPVYVSECVETPCLFGGFRPEIYIRPKDAGDENALRYILRHETMHYRHKDHVWSLLRSLCLVLHWYNPLVWVCAFKSKADGELACDESVILGMSEENKKEYGKVLIDLTVDEGKYGDLFCCATTMTGGKKSLKERIKRIATERKVLWIPTLAVVVLCTVVVGVTFTGARTSDEKDREGTRTENAQQTGGDGTEPAEDSEQELVLETGNEPETEGETETTQESETTPEIAPVEENVLEQPRVFVNDFFADFNGDGIRDIIRLESVYGPEDEENAAVSRDNLIEYLKRNVAGYMELVLYDGALIGEDMDSFKEGTEISGDAIVEIIGNCAHAHAGNCQYSYYEEDGKGYIVYSAPYAGQGSGSYNYQVFTYDKEWNRLIEVEKRLRFEMESWYGAPRHGDFETFFAEFFPVEEMVSYTLELKEYLDKAGVIADTSTGDREKFLVSTHFDEQKIVADAYDIWYWYEGVTASGVVLSEVQTPEELRVALEGIRLANWIISHYFLDEENAGDKKKIKVQSAAILASDSNGSDQELCSGVVPYKAQEAAEKQCEVLYQIARDDNNGEFTDWIIPEIQWTCTWDLNGKLVDVYSYKMYLYTDNPDSVVYVGGMEDRGDGWFEKDYGLCVAYDRESGQYFTAGGNDITPTDYNFVLDLVWNNYDLYGNIFSE